MTTTSSSLPRSSASDSQQELTPLLVDERQEGSQEMSSGRLRPISSQDPVASDGAIMPSEPFYRRIFNWSKLSTLEKGLALFAVLFLLLWLIFLGLFITAKSSSSLSPISPPSRDDTSNGICITPECTMAGYEMLSLMNSSADPCEDFDQYACGGWLKKNTIPVEESSFGIFSAIAKENKESLRRILEDENSLSLVEPDGKPILEKVFNYYSSCMDTKTIDGLGTKPLKDLAAKFVRIWPAGVVEDQETKEHRRKRFTELIDFASIHGIDAFFDLAIYKDAKLDYNTVQVSQRGSSGTYLPSKDRWENKDLVDTYTNTLASLFEAAPFTQELEIDPAANKDRAKQMATRAVAFERELANIAMNPADLRDPVKTYNNITLIEFNELLPIFDLALFITNYTDKPVPEPIIVENKDWLKKFNQLLTKSDDQEIQSYFLGQIYLQKANLVDEQTYRKTMPLRAALYGVDPMKLPERWDTCVRATDGALGFALGRLFVDEAFPGDSKKIAEDVVNAIRQGFKDRLPSLAWLDKQTAEKAIQKLDNIHLKMGYPDKSPNTTSYQSLQEYYSDMAVLPRSYFANSMSASGFYARRAVAKTVGLPPDPNAWGMTPPTVNAYFSPKDNDIAFPAGILQRTLFHYTYPEYLNFGSMGAVIGHEITHAFDDQGSQYDQNGRLNSWWPDEVRERFTNKTQCFIEQYGRYSIGSYNGTERFVNGRLTLGENLADNGGLKQAYTAWKKRFENESGDHSANVLLPGLTNLSRDKMFFIRFGQTWCTKSRPEYLLNQVESDVHSPAMIRVLGALSNAQEFADVFNCSAGARFSPKDKCDLW